MLDQHEAPTPAADDNPQAAPNAQPATGETAATESTPSLETLLKQAELAAQEHHDAWLRAKADADNIRKRAQADIANAHKYAIENFSTELLAVKDSLEAALAVSNVTAENLQKRRRADAETAELRVRKIPRHRNQSGRREIRSASPPGDQHGRSRGRAQYRGAGVSEGLSAATTA